MSPERYIQRLELIRTGRYKTRRGAVRAFQRIVLEFYEEHGRCFAWRDTRDPYKILVSEVMLQQTQTTRAVHDRDVLQLIADSIVEHRSRDWFYALMDIGVELKRLRPGINRASKHYARQSTFKGSDREVTAKVLKFVLSRSRSVRELEIYEKISAKQSQIQRAINRLERDSLVVRTRTGRIRPV